MRMGVMVGEGTGAPPIAMTYDCRQIPESSIDAVTRW